MWPNLDEWGVSDAGWWILLHLDRNRKAAASSVPSLNAKLHSTDAGYYFVVHSSQKVFAMLLQSLLRESFQL